MAGYPYRPELKRPGPISSIDFGNPALAPMVGLVVRNQRQAARAWHPPAGVALRILPVLSRDGEPVECFVLEPDTDEFLPGMLFCHGGGFFLPVQTTALELAAVYAQRLQARVFVPEYRILPKHPNPCPFQDCRAVWVQMLEQAEAHRLDGRVLLYGESAGGALAAGLAQMIRDKGEPRPRGQALIYPVLDDQSERYPSMERYNGAVWTKRNNDFMWSAYLKNGAQGLEPYVVPMGGRLEDLPPAYIEPQGIDILRDEAVAYAEQLRATGAPVELNIIEGSYHGFDADVENPFVQQIITRRVQAMAGMLAREKNEVNSHDD